MAKSNDSSKVNEANQQQRRLFAYNYFHNGGNGTRAAIDAGYSKKTAAEQSSFLLKSVKVKAILKKLNDKLENRAIISKERVLNEYAKIGLFDLRTLYDTKGCLKPISSLNDAAGAALQGLEVEELYSVVDGKRIKTGVLAKIKLHSKIAALDSIRDTMGWRAPATIAQTDKKGNDVNNIPIFQNVPVGYVFGMLPSNTESDSPEDMQGYSGI